MSKMIQEFKTFIARRNVMDLAVGVIMGGAFGKIVTSLVDNILMPFIGLALRGVNFSNLSIKFKDATIQYGLFIQNIIDFLIVSACIFFLIKFVNKLTHKKEEEKKDEEVKKSDEVLLLEEIRDLLKAQEKGSK